MAYDVTATFQAEQVKLENIFIINMYCVNASQSGWDPLYYWNGNQDIYGFQLNSNGSVTATEQVYVGLPISQDSLKTNISGEIPQLSISIPNTDRTVEAVIQNNDYLRGREIHVLTCFAKHLPSGATAKHIGSSPDHNAVLKEKMYIDSTTSNEQAVTFICKPKFNIKNIIVPGRKFSRECAWNYLGTECDPDGNINAASFPTCDGTLKQCRERGNTYRFGGWPSIPLRGITVT